MSASRPVGRVEDPAADRAALGRMARGDHDALAELYDRHSRGLYSLALRILQDAGEAEDVVQDVFTQAWRQASSYDAARGAVAAWLLMLTRSRAIDRLRARRSRPDLRSAPLPAIETADGSATPDVRILSAEQIARVRLALRDLPVLQRVAIEMAYYQGLSHTEIAAQLEQPLGTVKTRIRQAMIRLRDALAGTR